MAHGRHGDHPGRVQLKQAEGDAALRWHRAPAQASASPARLRKMTKMRPVTLSFRLAAPAMGAMAAIFDDHARGVEEYVDAFAAGGADSGAVFAIGDEVVGLDLKPGAAHLFDAGTRLRLAA